jgi:hypothetical protein
MLAVHLTISGDLKALGNVIEGDIEKWQQELAYRIVDESRRIMDESTPRGRVYRRGSIKGRRTKQGIVAGLRESGKTRMIVGYRIHRASAPGQPPAEDSGKTYRDITVRRMSKGTYRVRFGGAAGYLEFGTYARSSRGGSMGPHRGGMLARPYIIPAIEAAVRKTFAESKLFN